jgi:hypothetical protein
LKLRLDRVVAKDNLRNQNDAATSHHPGGISKRPVGQAQTDDGFELLS